MRNSLTFFFVLWEGDLSTIRFYYCLKCGKLQKHISWFVRKTVFVLYMDFFQGKHEIKFGKKVRRLRIKYLDLILI